MTPELQKMNIALRYLGKITEGKDKFIFSKLGNELTLIITKQCNLNCSFCYDKGNLYDNSSLKDELTSIEIVNLIGICRKMGVNRIRLTGGEAILKDGFLEILKACDGIYTTLCSNGLILMDNIEEIVNIHPEKLHIHLSIDGIETHKKIRVGSDPKKIVNVIHFLKKNYPNIDVSVNTVINNENIYELIDIFILIKNEPINRWTISFPRFVDIALKAGFKMPKIEDLVKEFNKLMKAYYNNNKPFDFSFSYFYKYEFLNTEKYIPPAISNSHPCLPYCSGSRGLIVDSFGNILDCLVMKPFVVPKPVNIKSLLSDNNLSIQEFVFALQFTLESKFYDLVLMNMEKCLQCRYLNLCKGGCPANAYYISGNLCSEDILSCFLFYNFEKYVLPNLSIEDQQIYITLINTQKDIKVIENKIKLNKKTLIKVGGLT